MANTGFIRFRDVTIPANSRIISAVVIFTGFAPNSDINTNILCYFEDADSPGVPTDKTDLDGRSLTSGVDWLNIEEWKDNYVYQTPQLATILQAVINRDGWTSGNDVLFLGVDSSSGSYRLWSAFEYLGGIEKASLLVSWDPPEQIDTPLIEPVEGFQVDIFNCSIRTYPTDSSIYYTIDGSTPDENSTLYSAPFSISSNTIVKAMAYRQYWTPSEVATQTYIMYSVNYWFYDNQTLLRVGRANFGEGQVSIGGFIRFRNITIPQGATITTAFLRFYHQQYSSETAIVKTDLCFHAADNSGIITTGEIFRGLVDIQSTTRNLWDITTTWNGYTWYNSIDFTSSLQEVIDRSGWSSGNNATLFIDTEPYYSELGSSVIRVIKQRVDVIPGNDPELHVTWVGGSGTFYTVDYEDDAEVRERQ